MSADSAIARRRALARREGNPSYVQKRSRMLNAVTALSNEKECDATTLADVALAVGVARASIYSYVEGKVARALRGMHNWTSRGYRPERASTAQEVTHVSSELFLRGLAAQPGLDSSQPVGIPGE